MQFWASLLRQPTADGVRARPRHRRCRVAPGPRAALLLRLVAGLDVIHAAEALGVSEPAYEAALRAGAGPSGAGRRRAAGAARALHAPDPGRCPPPSAQLLATWRDAGRARARRRPANPRRRRARRCLRADDGAAAHAAALDPGSAGARCGLAAGPAVHGAATAGRRARRRSSNSVAPPPALSDTVAVTHPDYLQIAAPATTKPWRGTGLPELAGRPRPCRRALPAPAERCAGAAGQLRRAGRTDMQAVLASAPRAWPDLDPADARAPCCTRPHDWLARPARRTRAAARAHAGLGPAGGARTREPARAVPGLAATRRQRSSTAARGRAPRLAALARRRTGRPCARSSPPRRRTRSALWWLGPALGQELAPIASLFAFLPEADRPPCWLALRGLDAAARARSGDAGAAPGAKRERQALRRDLLAAPPEQRAALIRERLGSSSSARGAQHAALGAEPLAEAGDAVGAQARRMFAQVVGQARRRRAGGTACRAPTRPRAGAGSQPLEHLRAAEAGQRDDLAHVRVEPGAELGARSRARTNRLTS